jgi:cytochrome d ubiquinol oxidase subunit I
MLKIATCIAVVLVPAQIHIGHDHGLNTMEYQPIKLAAMEGNWSEERHAPLILFGIPTQEKMEYEIKIPGLSSWILTGDINGKIPRLNDYPPENYPPIFIVFWSFRIMVGVGVLMLITAIISFIQLLRQKLFDNKYLQLLWIMMIPSGFIAILAGWSVTEVGRQPWTVYNIIRTVKSISPGVNGHQVAWSLITIIIMYCLVFCAGLYYILKIINKGFVINTMHKYHITVSGRHNV